MEDPLVGDRGPSVGEWRTLWWGMEDPLVWNGGPSGGEWRTVLWRMEHRDKNTIYKLSISTVVGIFLEIRPVFNFLYFLFEMFTACHCSEYYRLCGQ